jgi:hypothetical protein
MAGCGSIPSTWEPETGGSQGQGQSGLCGSLSQKKNKKIHELFPCVKK